MKKSLSTCLAGMLCIYVNGQTQIDSSPIYYDGPNVGIGTTSPSKNLHVSSGTSGDAVLMIESDTDNNNENDNPYLMFSQDNGGAKAFIGMVGDNNLAPQSDNHPRWFQNPDGSWSSFNDYQGTLTNSLLLSTNDAKAIQFGTFGFVRMTVRENGNIGIGTLNPTADLTVNGKIEAEEIEVKNVGADYVFQESYDLMPLKEVERFISVNKHLPNIPPASKTEQGVELGAFSEKLLAKIEELTLYMIQQQKELEELKKENILLKERTDQID